MTQPELSRKHLAHFAAAPHLAEPMEVAAIAKELAEARTALDEIATYVQPDDDGTWTDADGLLESIGNAVESTGRKVWEDM